MTTGLPIFSRQRLSHLTDSGITGLLDQTSQLSQPEPSGKSPEKASSVAIVYMDPELKGKSQALTVGRYDTKDLTLPNDSISSVAVDSGYKVTLYEDSGFSGRSVEITTDTEALAVDIDGTASSLVVEKA